MKTKETLKCMSAFNDRDPCPTCLFTASAKSPLSPGALPRSLHPQDPQLQLVNLPSLLWAFILDWKQTLLEDWIQPYHSKLLLSIMWYIFPVFIFQTMFACPLSQWLSTLTKVRQFVGQFIVDKKHGWKMSLAQLRRRFTNRVMVTRLIIKYHFVIWQLPLRVCYRVYQCKAYVNVQWSISLVIICLILV